MSKKVEFSVDDEDAPILLAYAKAKGHRTISNLARYATFALMSRNPVGRHDLRRGADRTEAPAGRNSGGSE